MRKLREAELILRIILLNFTYQRPAAIFDTGWLA
jgi:hypothetical protein